jgi:type VI secretion system secreted protein Hcp
MAADVFLVIPPDKNSQITAELVKDPQFNQTFPNAVAVPVRSFSFGTENVVQIGSASSGAGAGKLHFNSLVVEKAVDRLSPSLLTFSAQGNHFATLQLAVRKAGGAAQGGKPYLVYEFQTVFVTDLQWSGAAGDEPAEQITFTYGGLTLGYFLQKPDGSLGPLTKQGWSQILNKATGPETLAGF